jgi:type I pantothenate kinase
MRLRETAFRDPQSYFRRYAEKTEMEAMKTALSLWYGINLVNLRDNVLPTRQRATLILKKGPEHGIETVSLRRL